MMFDVNSTHRLQNISLNKNLILHIIRSVINNSSNTDFPVILCASDISSDNFRAKFDLEDDIRNQLSNKIRINYVNFYFQNPQKSLRDYKVAYSIFVSIEYNGYSDSAFHQLRISASSNNAIQAEDMLENVKNWLAACLPIDTQSISERNVSEQIVVSSENKTEDKVPDNSPQITINNPSISIGSDTDSENKTKIISKDLIVKIIQIIIIGIVTALLNKYL